MKTLIVAMALLVGCGPVATAPDGGPVLCTNYEMLCGAVCVPTNAECCDAEASAWCANGQHCGPSNTCLPNGPR